MKTFLILNPNASEAMTQAMDACLEDLRPHTPHRLICRRNPKGPSGIETDAQVAAVVPHLAAAIEDTRADAYVVACFSDPGVDRLRRTSLRPIVGIAEAAYHAALSVGARFGVISLGEASVRRHAVRIAELGLSERLAGDRAANLDVDRLEDDGVLPRLVAAGTALREIDRADVIILGCAGLGRYRATLQQRLGVPVIDPVQAAVAQLCALSMLQLLETPAAQLQSH